MKISIITVCKNAENTIDKTIQSVINQSYSNIEYIIIDGASKDATLQVIERYKENISRLISEPDNGLYDAMNKGIAEATGEFLYFLNSDDILIHENVIDNAVKRLKNLQEDIIYGNVLFINKKTGSGYLFQKEKLDKFFFYKKSLAHPSIFFRRSAFDKFGKFNTNFKIVSDYEWLLKAFIRGLSFKHINIIVAVFYIGGLSSNPKYNLLHFSERNKVINEYFSYLEKIKFNIKLLFRNLFCLNNNAN